jgi:hypothetical protein
MTAPWWALVEAHNNLPTGHPTRRAVVALLGEAAHLPDAVRDQLAQQSIVALMLSPPMPMRQRLA